MRRLQGERPQGAGARVFTLVRPLVPGRRLRAYLATGQYRHELANARWIP